MAAQYLIEKHEVDFPSLSPVSMGFLHILQNGGLCISVNADYPVEKFQQLHALAIALLCYFEGLSMHIYLLPAFTMLSLK